MQDESMQEKFEKERNEKTFVPFPKPDDRVAEAYPISYKIFYEMSESLYHFLNLNIQDSVIKINRIEQYTEIAEPVNGFGFRVDPGWITHKMEIIFTPLQLLEGYRELKLVISLEETKTADRNLYLKVMLFDREVQLYITWYNNPHKKTSGKTEKSVGSEDYHEWETLQGWTTFVAKRIFDKFLSHPPEWYLERVSVTPRSGLHTSLVMCLVRSLQNLPYSSLPVIASTSKEVQSRYIHYKTLLSKGVVTIMFVSVWDLRQTANSLNPTDHISPLYDYTWNNTEDNKVHPKGLMLLKVTFFDHLVFFKVCNTKEVIKISKKLPALIDSFNQALSLQSSLL